MITLLYNNELIGAIQDPSIYIIDQHYTWDTHVIRFTREAYNKIFQNYKQNVPLQLKNNNGTIFNDVWIDKPNYIWSTQDWILYENVKLTGCINEHYTL